MKRGGIRMRVLAKGAEEIRDALNMLPQEVSGQHLRDVALMGAEVIRAQAEANAAAIRETGTLAGDIHAEVAKETLGKSVTVQIGPGRKGWYGRLVEYGHAIIRGTRKATRRVIGQVPPHPWLRPAFDAAKERAQQVMIAEFRRRLERVWRR